MTERVQELIDKIKSEGIEAAEARGEEIRQEAQEQAEAIVAKARREAEQQFAEARARQEKLEAATRAALEQSARDMLLRLRQNILGILDGILKEDLRASLTPEVLARVIETVAREYLKDRPAAGVTVALGEKDLKALQEGALKKLQDALKQPLTLRSSEHIRKGFTISFDEGKSSFDFTDESLAGFLGQSLSDFVAGIVKGAVPPAGK
jgi:vacuolar-type H+-ATPase subunit E/Vma4